ncbi:MAG: hypothetical protein JNL58_13740 [Planctomyces sp.]|nr:hypothetical protein [Planctomyces sp.]
MSSRRDHDSQQQNSVQKSWSPQPAGTSWIQKQIQSFREENSTVGLVEQLLKEHSGSRLFDWVDHLILKSIDGIGEAGFLATGEGWFEHPDALLPAVRHGAENRMSIRVDSVSDLAVANSHRFGIKISGQPLDLRRIATFEGSSDWTFGAIERHGCTAATRLPQLTVDQKIMLTLVRERFRHRARQFSNEQEAYRAVRELVEQAIADVGRDVACALFFEGERAYWMSRNRAGRIQYMRQCALGLGWGNHDHHTYRSSRHCFSDLISLLELLGFQCRERFYAGAEAGWGAQVLEQPVAGVVIFADVDMAPEEIANDFSHQPLLPRQQLGTIGLWCALHGEAMFQAGMHHLECQYDFDGARAQLEELGVKCMKPFTDFPFLRQCFTEGERWPIRPDRIERALRNQLITEAQAQKFLQEGAVGSHLEVLERNDGYRGFNQTGINDIIRKTDPRFLSPTG